MFGPFVRRALDQKQLPSRLPPTMMLASAKVDEPTEHVKAQRYRYSESNL